MRHRWLLLAFVVAAPACATILGIDDGIPREDASVDATVDLTVIDVGTDVVDAPIDVPPPPLTVACGDAGDCTVGQSICCRRGAVAPFTYACVTDAAACTGTNPKFIACDKASICAGFDAGDAGPPVCCADLNDAGGVLTLASVFCTGEKACIATGQVMCPTVSDAGDSGCTSPRTCKNAPAVLSGYHTCQ